MLDAAGPINWSDCRPFGIIEWNSPKSTPNFVFIYTFSCLFWMPSLSELRVAQLNQIFSLSRRKWKNRPASPTWSSSSRPELFLGNRKTFSVPLFTWLAWTVDYFAIWPCKIRGRETRASSGAQFWRRIEFYVYCRIRMGANTAGINIFCVKCALQDEDVTTKSVMIVIYVICPLCFGSRVLLS